MTAVEPTPTKKTMNPWLAIGGGVTGFLTLFLGGLWIGLLFVYEKLEPNDRRLPDGSILRLEKVTCGSTHECSYEFQKRMWGIFPTPQKQLLRHATEPDQLVVWMTRRSSRTGSPMNFAWWQSSRLLDKFGKELHDYQATMIELGGLHEQRTLRDAPKAKVRSADAWMALSCFPQHRTVDGMLRLKIRNTAGNVVAEFEVPHPSPADPPMWSPESLPMTKTDRDLSVTLERIEVTPIKDLSSPNPKRWHLAPKFTLHWRDGRRRDCILPTHAVISPWTKDPEKVHNQCFESAFHEPAWKFRLAVVKYPYEDFEPDELATIRNISLPPADTAILHNEKVSANGVTLELVAIAGAGTTSYFVPRTVPLERDFLQSSTKDASLKFEMSLAEPNRMRASSSFPHVLYRIHLADRYRSIDTVLLDDRGAKPKGVIDLHDKEFRGIVFQPATDSKTVDLTIIAQIAREFEFTFKPPELNGR